MCMPCGPRYYRSYRVRRQPQNWISVNAEREIIQRAETLTAMKAVLGVRSVKRIKSGVYSAQCENEPVMIYSSMQLLEEDGKANAEAVKTMYVLYKTTGMGGRICNHILRVGEPSEIAKLLLYEDSLLCLLGQGRSMGTKTDQKELDKIEALYESYQEDSVTSRMLQTFGFNISTGEHKCIGFAKTKEEVEALCLKLETIFDATSRRGTPSGMRFMEVVKSIREEADEPSDDLVERINGIQYIV